MRVAIVGSDARARLALVTALDDAPPTWSLSLHREPPPDADVVVCDPEAGIPGAVVFDGGDAASLVARVASSARRAATIVVTSPSGGMGATTVALHLAAELVARGLTTCFVDLDERWGARSRLGLEAADEPEAAPVPAAAGFRLLTGIGSLEAARGTFDRVVVDAPIEPFTNLDISVGALLVATPTPEGARRARSVLDAHPSVAWRVVANRIGPGGEMTHAHFQRAVGISAYELPCCPALRDSEDDARLLGRGWTRWSRRIARLAAEIEG